METVKAPEGFEAVRYWHDGTKSWMVSYKRTGARWWTNLGLIGHAHLTREELDARAEARLADARLGIEAYERHHPGRL